MEKQEQIPGINQETRKQGVLKGFEENQIPPPPNYIQSMNNQQMTANQMSGNACNRISQLPMGIGQPNSIKIPLDPDYDSDYDSDDDESDEPYEPFVKTCLCCCNLGVGVILGSLFFLIFDAMLLIKKTTMMFEEDKNEISSLNFGMNTASVILNAFSCFSSFILMASACLCGTPERSTSMRFLVRYWMFTLGLNTAYQVIETLMNTLPDPNSIFVVSMPSLGFPEIMGPPAIIITWAFTSVYMFAYLYMCLVGVSYTRELNVKIYKKEVKHESKINQRIASQIPNFDDIQSNMTYTERLSDMSRESSEDVYQEVNGSDMTGLDDIYARKSGLKRSPSPRILQAQLAYLSPAQRIQFLTQLSQQGGLPGLPAGSSPSPSLPVPPGGLPVSVNGQGVGPTGLPLAQLPGLVKSKPQTVLYRF